MDFVRATREEGRGLDTQACPRLITFQPLSNYRGPNPAAQTLVASRQPQQRASIRVRKINCPAGLPRPPDADPHPQRWDESTSSNTQVTYTHGGENASPASAGSGTTQEGAKNPHECLLEVLSSFRANAVMWFEKTQASHILQNGELPEWFHGFISRRESEDLLKDKPQGCFLVRLSESKIGLVLSYRGFDRCRHFLIDQLQDGQYAILGEDSYHTSLKALLLHYSTSPIPPFMEHLTQACPKMPDFKPPLPQKLSQAAQSALTPVEKPDNQGTNTKVVGTYAKVNKPKSQEKQQQQSAPLEQKYTQLTEIHTYAEPNENMVEGRHIYNEPVDPIAFYAMMPGSMCIQTSGDTLPENADNVYSELDSPPCRNVYWSDPMRTLPTAPASVHQPLQRCGSSRARTLPITSPRNIPYGNTTLRHHVQVGSPLRLPVCIQPFQARSNPQQEFDDPVYGRSTTQRPHNAPDPNTQQQVPENLYESIAEGGLKSMQLPLAPRTSR